MNNVDLTYSGKIKGRVNVIKQKNFDVNYTIEGENGLVTTTSILVDDSKGNFLMITFNYQELKELVEGKNE